MSPGRRLGVSGALDVSAAVLSPRQLEYLELRAAGFTIACTAARMGISESTAKSLLQQVHDKLRVTNTIEALLVVGWLKVPKGRESR